MPTNEQLLDLAEDGFGHVALAAGLMQVAILTPVPPPGEEMPAPATDAMLAGVLTFEVLPQDEQSEIIIFMLGYLAHLIDLGALSLDHAQRVLDAYTAQATEVLP